MARDKRVSVFWLIVLVIGVVWLLNELDILPIDLPWLPIILIVLALGMLINKSNR